MLVEAVTESRLICQLHIGPVQCLQQMGLFFNAFVACLALWLPWTFFLKCLFFPFYFFCSLWLWLTRYRPSLSKPCWLDFYRLLWTNRRTCPLPFLIFIYLFLFFWQTFIKSSSSSSSSSSHPTPPSGQVPVDAWRRSDSNTDSESPRCSLSWFVLIFETSSLPTAAFLFFGSV